MSDQSDDEILEVSLFHTAVLKGNLELVRQLVDADHDVIKEKDEEERTALYIASQMGQADTVQLLLDKGADVEAMNTTGYTPLHTASEQNHSNLVKILLEHGANINARDRSWGATPLTMASFWNSTETVRVLLEAGADASVAAYFDYSPLGCAAFKGNTDIVALLLKHRKGINTEKRANGGLTPLMHAVANSYDKIIKMLLDYGANVNATDASGASVLHILAQKEDVNIPVMKLLIKHGANLTLVDDNGNTPLHTAAQNNQIDVAKVLVQSNIPLNTQNQKGNTALHIACEKGCADMSRYLQQVGANASIRNNQNDLAIDLAYCADHHYIVEIMKQVSQVSENIQSRRAEYKRQISQSSSPYRSGSGPIAAPRKNSASTSSQRSNSPASRSGSQKSDSYQRFYSEPDEINTTKSTSNIAQGDKSRDSYIVPITLEDSAVNVPHYEDLDHESTKKMSVHELPDISQGIPPSSTTSLALPQRMDEKYHPGTATVSPQFTDRLYGMGIGQSGTMPPPLAQQQSKPGTEQKKKIKNPFKYFLQKREKSQSSSKAKPVTIRLMAGYQTGQGQMCRQLELLHIQPEIKNIVSQFYIEFDKLILGDLIGRGNFGRVYKGSLETPSGYQQIAIKTTKYRAEETEMIEEFLKEALLMKDFKHPHVLSLIGVTFDLNSNPLVVLPFMSHGNLRAYIRDPQKTLSIHRLLGMGLQAARGMEYLSKCKFVHRDLACRNCMVSEADGSTVVKVADFGLSRDLYFRDYYRISDRMTPLPVRWMAPESLQTNIFKLESDVWSYGVLVWELLTRGATPYSDVENWDINKYIAKGYRLEKPKYCPDKIYGIMQGCWNMDPAKRPSFTTIIQELEDHIHSEVYQSAEVNPSHHLTGLRKQTYFV